MHSKTRNFEKKSSILQNAVSNLFAGNFHRARSSVNQYSAGYVSIKNWWVKSMRVGYEIHEGECSGRRVEQTIHIKNRLWNCRFKINWKTWHQVEDVEVQEQEDWG